MPRRPRIRITVRNMKWKSQRQFAKDMGTDGQTVVYWLNKGETYEQIYDRFIPYSPPTGWGGL